ncbi:APC family permease [Leucobacter sp. UT-8R-CII-1-4]|uniref:APC family permease n=1 Tax=Leucobacter sp. UT-8R-CII-1-4 TaxID=3040075 RepID=UPI0024A834FB|nr:APC family permease [Leucobacter sp. UT-8R-CII-1-4]MDI6022957.1 APC family permease [Leucobacter sp. UT-8R-CII-1-4]
MAATTDPPTRALDSVTGISRKGLPQGTVGVLGAIVIGLSVCAPAYTLTSAVGPAASEVGYQTPAIFLAGFLPMLLVAIGYRSLNSAMPDSGTSFTWASRAFGPWVGWMAGWGLIAATVLVLSNLAGIAVEFLFQSIAIIANDPSIADIAGNRFINILVCLGFMTMATVISYRGMTSTKVFQYITVTFQVAVLIWFIIAMFIGAADSANTEGRMPELSWFNPLEVSSFSAFAAGIAVSIFVYWGWDTVLTMGEETKPSKGRMSTESKAAMILVVLLVVMYVGTAAATVAFAGIGDGPTGLGNSKIAENVFAALAHPVMGPAAILLSLAILVSAMASINSTAISPARTLLAMAHYGALPKPIKKIHPKYKSPYVALMWSSIVASVFYAIMRFLSEDVLWDTITALGMMVCFYYGITALASTWYFRKAAPKEGFRSVMSKMVLPGLGGVLLLVVFVQTTIDSMNPDFGSGSSIGGVGLVGIIGVVVLGLGVVLMFVQSRFSPAFFKGKVLSVADATTDTSNMELFDDGIKG